uniref:Uncharacterized protein n=1 Tax=Panagrolaimus sp. JU765 TaxID=591449 RepID=A0AC34R178_9BILA
MAESLSKKEQADDTSDDNRVSVVQSRRHEMYTGGGSGYYTEDEEDHAHNSGPISNDSYVVANTRASIGSAEVTAATNVDATFQQEVTVTYSGDGRTTTTDSTVETTITGESVTGTVATSTESTSGAITPTAGNSYSGSSVTNDTPAAGQESQEFDNVADIYPARVTAYRGHGFSRSLSGSNRRGGGYAQPRNHAGGQQLGRNRIQSSPMYQSGVATTSVSNAQQRQMRLVTVCEAEVLNMNSIRAENGTNMFKIFGVPSEVRYNEIRFYGAKIVFYFDNIFAVAKVVQTNILLEFLQTYKGGQQVKVICDEDYFQRTLFVNAHQTWAASLHETVGIVVCGRWDVVTLASFARCWTAVDWLNMLEAGLSGEGACVDTIVRACQQNGHHLRHFAGDCTSTLLMEFRYNVQHLFNSSAGNLEIGTLIVEDLPPTGTVANMLNNVTTALSPNAVLNIIVHNFVQTQNNNIMLEEFEYVSEKRQFTTRAAGTEIYGVFRRYYGDKEVNIWLHRKNVNFLNYAGN